MMWFWIWLAIMAPIVLACWVWGRCPRCGSHFTGSSLKGYCPRCYVDEFCGGDWIRWEIQMKDEDRDGAAS